MKRLNLVTTQLYIQTLFDLARPDQTTTTEAAAMIREISRPDVVAAEFFHDIHFSNRKASNLEKRLFTVVTHELLRRAQIST
jgi:hypothetical protein